MASRFSLSSSFASFHASLSDFLSQPCPIFSSSAQDAPTLFSTTFFPTGFPHYCYYCTSHPRAFNSLSLFFLSLYSKVRASLTVRCFVGLYNDLKSTYSFHQAFQCGILKHEGIKHLLRLLAHVQQDCVVKKRKIDRKLSEQSMCLYGMEKTNPKPGPRLNLTVRRELCLFVRLRSWFGSFVWV